MLDERTIETDGPVLGTDFDPAVTLLAHNRLSINGWAAAQTGIEHVRVRIADRDYTASFGLPTPMGVGDLPDWPDTAHSRFELSLDTSRWPRGEYSFEILATDRSGATSTIPGTTDIQPYDPPPSGDDEAVTALAEGRPAMWCEAPNLFATQEVSMPVEVTGWASSVDGIETVLVTIDGRTRMEAVHGMVRPDLRSRLGEQVGLDGGFALRLDGNELPSGWHELAVVAITRNGVGLGVSGMVNCVVGKPSKVAPDEVVSTPGGVSGAGSVSVRTADEHIVAGPDEESHASPEHYARYRWASSLVRNAKVLDVGCGFGSGTALLARHAKRATGVDISPPIIAAAASNNASAADFRVADLHQLPFSDDEFDIVVCFEVIEQVTDAEKGLDEMRRVLSRDGLLLISAANAGAYPSGNPLHVRELTSEDLQAALAPRFANVALYRQQTYFASLLGSDAELALDDPLSNLDASVAKAQGGPPGTELYTVAVATNTDPPEPAAQVALGSSVDYNRQRESIEAWQARAVQAETYASAATQESDFVRWQQRATLERAKASDEAIARCSELERKVAGLEGRLAASIDDNAALQASASWRLTEPLRRLKRAVGLGTHRHRRT